MFDLNKSLLGFLFFLFLPAAMAINNKWLFSLSFISQLTLVAALIFVPFIYVFLSYLFLFFITFYLAITPQIRLV